MGTLCFGFDSAGGARPTPPLVIPTGAGAKARA